MKRKIFTFLCGVFTALILVTSLKWFTPTSVVAQTNTTLLISAAASLQDALKEVQPIFQQTQSNIKVNYNFGSSGALQQQIENGAPVDLFISAAQKQMDALASKGLILTDTRRNLLTNRLVLIVPSNSQLNLTSFNQLTANNLKRIAIGEPKSVPAGQYASEVSQKLGISQQVKPKFVLGNTVRQVLSFVESGNADAGVVYISDAKSSKRVKQVLIVPENLHSPIIYPVAVLKDSKNIPAAKEYLQFLSSTLAKPGFQKYGFSTL